MTAKGQNQKQKRIKNDTLLEALRDLGSGVGKTATEDFFSQIPEDILSQTGLRPKRTSGRLPIPPELVNSEEKEEFSQRLRRTEVIRRQEKLIFSAKEQETKLKVGALQEEVKKLAQATVNLTQEVKIASIQTPVEPGIYHLSFFEKLISFIHSVTQKVEDATSWASAFNQRAKKRSYYWTQVGRSGSKFMLSQERYMATQAG